MKKLVKLSPLVLLLVIGLFAGCGGGSKKTAVDPNDLTTMTNSFANGSGAVTQDVVEGLLKSAPEAAAAGAGTATTLGGKVKFKSSSDAFGFTFKTLNSLKVPRLKNLMENILSYATIGKINDQSGVVRKMMGFNNDPKLTGDQINASLPSCMYISGLPSALENMITNGTLTPSTLDEANALSDFMKSFNITIGFDGTCDVSTGLTVEGSLNIKGGINLKMENNQPTNIDAKITITLNTIKSTVTGASSTTITTASGSMGISTSVDLSGTTFSFDLLFTASKLNLTEAVTEGTNTSTQKDYLDGAAAFHIASPATTFTYKIPDLCNMTLTFVIDMTIGSGDPATDYAEQEILWGMKLGLTGAFNVESSASDLSVCSGLNYQMTFIFFVDKSTYYLVNFLPPTAPYDLVIQIVGSPGEEVTLSVDFDADTCVVSDASATVTLTECTWNNSWEISPDGTSPLSSISGFLYPFINHFLNP